MRIFLTFQVLGSKRVLGIPIAFSVHLRFCLEKATHKTRFGGFMSHPQVRYRPGSHIPNQVLNFQKLVLMPPETPKRVLKMRTRFDPRTGNIKTMRIFGNTFCCLCRVFGCATLTETCFCENCGCFCVFIVYRWKRVLHPKPIFAHSAGGRFSSG